MLRELHLAKIQLKIWPKRVKYGSMLAKIEQPEVAIQPRPKLPESMVVEAQGRRGHCALVRLQVLVLLATKCRGARVDFVKSHEEIRAGVGDKVFDACEVAVFVVAVVVVRGEERGSPGFFPQLRYQQGYQPPASLICRRRQTSSPGCNTNESYQQEAPIEALLLLKSGPAPERSDRAGRNSSGMGPASARTRPAQGSMFTASAGPDPQKLAKNGTTLGRV